MATKTNAEIAAAFEELGDLYELDGAVSYRVIAYRTAAKAVRDASVSIMALTREGKVTTVPGIGKTLEEKLRALDETGDIPSAVKLRAKFPSRADRDHAPARASAPSGRSCSTTSSGSTRWRRCARRPRRSRSASIRGLGKKVEENLLRVLAEQEEGGGPAPRILLSRALPVAEQIAGALRDHPAADRVEIAGSRAPDGRHGQGHRHHRHRERRAGADLDAGRAAAGRVRRGRPATPARASSRTRA